MIGIAKVWYDALGHLDLKQGVGVSAGGVVDIQDDIVGAGSAERVRSVLGVGGMTVSKIPAKFGAAGKCGMIGEVDGFSDTYVVFVRGKSGAYIDKAGGARQIVHVKLQLKARGIIFDGVDKDRVGIACLKVDCWVPWV